MPAGASSLLQICLENGCAGQIMGPANSGVLEAPPGDVNNLSILHFKRH
jgi:hypothetical protein